MRSRPEALDTNHSIQETRDSYDNLILLCANDHREVDSQPAQYSVEKLRGLKRDHEYWVRSRLRVDAAGTVVTLSAMESGAQMWALLADSLAYQCESPEGIADQEADLVDDAMQEFVDWGNIAADVETHGFRAIRDAKRSVQAQLDLLREAGFVVFGGTYAAVWAPAQITGKVLCLKVVRLADLTR